MAALTAQDILDSFEQVLHVDTDGGGNGTTYVPIKDGDNGTTFVLQISTRGIKLVDPTSSYEIELTFTGSGNQPTIKMRADDGTYCYVYPKKDGMAYTLACTPVAPS